MATEATPEPTKIQHPRRWQFGLRSLFLLPLFVGVALVLFTSMRFGEFTVMAIFAVPLLVCCILPKPELAVLKCLIAYGAASIVSLPFLNSWWLGELPVLALIHVPKTSLANWLRNIMVMDLMGPLGLSRGSFSPDWGAAGPYALAIAYLVPLAIVLVIVWRRTRMAPPHRAWACALVIVAILDYWMTLMYSSGPGLSIY